MDIPYWFIIGVIILAALITLVFSKVLSERDHDFIVLPDGETVLFEVYDNGVHVGRIMVNHEHEPVDQRTGMHNAKHGHRGAVLLPTPRDPGFNACHIIRKYKRLFKSAMADYSSTPIAMPFFPFEVLIRVAFFPVFTAVDIVSHDRKVFLYFVPDDINYRKIPEGVHLVEFYRGVHLSVRDCGEFHFEKKSHT